VSKNALRELYDRKAFKPTPSIWELAEAHVPFAELSAEHPPEQPIASGLREGDGIAALIGGGGSGKSSVLAHVAKRLAGDRTDRGLPYLPVFVPVAGRPEHATSLDTFGQGVILEVLLALRDSLSEHHRRRLEAALGDQVTRHRSGSKFVAKLIAAIPGLRGELGFELASDIVSIVGKQRLDGRGGLKTLGDIVRARDHELVVFVEDTDALAYGEQDLAAQFFGSVVRPLSADTDVGVAIAVQSRWVEGDAALGEAAAALERAVTAAWMPVATSDTHGRQMVEIVLERRVLRALDEPAALGEPAVRALFSDDALQVLGHELRATGSFRRPLAMVRDALDRHAEDLPDRLERTHLLETL
jgi:AAA ATPase domain